MPVCPAAVPKPRSDDAFFSAIPRAVLELRRGRGLQTRDVEVLALLLDYKNARSSEVAPRQATLAGRLGCSPDTIQRSLKRLLAAGLVVKTRGRDARGRLGRCAYDLAATLELMPVQAARLRHGEWGTDPARAASPAPPSRPHGCGILQADQNSVVKADNTVAVSPLALEMIACGVSPACARALAQTCGERRCREALAALRSRPRIRDRAAWLVSALRGGWTLAAPDPPDRPHSHRLYRPLRPDLKEPERKPLPPNCDPLAVLPPGELAALEGRARGLLLAESTGPVLALLRQGRERRLVRARMRAMLG